MALFMPGMRCSISGRILQSADEVVAFPAFIPNEADPLHIFNDTVVHVDVFRAHPLAAKAQARYEETRQRTAPGNRLCLICGKRITEPDSYLGLGYLVDSATHPLCQFNYAHFHRACLAAWTKRPQLIIELDNLNRSGSWKGGSLERLLKQLRTVALR